MQPHEAHLDVSKSKLTWAITAGVVFALAVTGSAAVVYRGATPMCPQPLLTMPGALSPIQHVFFLIKENHAFENYFGTLPGVAGYPPNGSFPARLGGSGTVRPFPLNGTSTPDLPHDRGADLVDLNGGRNDLFVAEAAIRGYAEPSDAVGFYTASQIPAYFEYAQSYTLADHFFSGVLGPTLPNRIFDLAGTSGAWTSDSVPPLQAVDFPTILNQLSVAGLPWFYDYAGARAGLTPLLLPQVAGDPCLVRAIQPLGNLTAQLNGPSPPAFAVIDGSHDLQYSEHPPANVTLGEAWTVSVVNAIFASPVGPSSAVFLFWDENGGFWDPISPPVTSPIGDGFRVPLLVLSAWTPAGLINHERLDPASLLRFVDDNWGLGYLDPEIGAAPVLSGFFDFHQAARAPTILPSPVTLWAGSS